MKTERKAFMIIICFILIFFTFYTTKNTNLTDNPSTDNIPAPDLIQDKDDFSILYVGNSLTYKGNVPKQVSAVCKMYGINVMYDRICPAGAKLNETMDKAIQKMQDNQYDYVIFQDYSTRPESDEEAFLSDVEILCEEARKSGAIPVLYNPAWANDNAKPDKVRQASLTACYERAAKVNGAILINAGEAWVYAYDKHPDISLYVKNDYHANKMGAYLTSCVFASTLFNLHIKDVAKDYINRSDEVINLGQAAWEYVSYYNEYKASPEGIVTVSPGINEKIDDINN